MRGTNRSPGRSNKLTAPFQVANGARVGGYDVKARLLSHNVLPSHFSSLIESVKSFFR